MEQEQTRTARLSFDGKILLTEVLDNIEIEVEDVEENFVVSARLTQDRPYLSMVITAPYSTITREGREATNQARYYRHVVAQAIVVNTLASRIMGNFLIGLFKKYCPQRLFTSREEALAWLEQHWQKAGN